MPEEKGVDTPSKRAKPHPQSSEKSKIIVQNDQKSDNAAKPKKKNGKGKGRAKQPVAESEGEDDDSDIEDAYATGKSAEKMTGGLDESDEGESDDEGPTKLIHESLQKKIKTTVRTPKLKYVPEDETPNLRDQRTIFVGNLPIELASKKVSQWHCLFVITRSKQNFMTSPCRNNYNGTFSRLCPLQKSNLYGFVLYRSKHLHPNYQLLMTKAMMLKPSLNHKRRRKRPGPMTGTVHRSGVQKLSTMTR